MQQAYDVLSNLPWSRDIHGFDNSEPLHKLTIYTSREWLATTHLDQMLDLLQQDLLLKGSRVEIENMTFFLKLQQAYNCCDTEVYDTSQAFAQPRSVALRLEAGEHNGLGIVMNIGGDHWVTVALDFTNSLIFFSDPFHNEPINKVTSVINWWTFHHTGRRFNWRKMKVTAQKDSFSCGLLAPNGLAHFYLPDTYQMISAAKVDTE